MEDEAYQLKRQENLRNPKNRFLGVFCHAEQVDSAWGCDWSFQCGVIFFSIIILACSFFDVYEIASNKIFSSAYSGGHQFFFGLKVFSDIINFIGIILGCIAVGYMNLKYSIISYYVAVLSLILNTIFFIYLFVAIFISWSKFWHEIAPVIFLEIGLVFFSWILFCNQVDVGRKKRALATNNGL